MDRSGRAGLPATTVSAGTSRVTTLPAPIRARRPMVTNGKMVTPAPTCAPSRIVGPRMHWPEKEQPGRFYELWTLKESYIKARGIGLGLGLSKFSFTVQQQTAQVRFDPGFPDDAGRWSFQLFRPDGEHVTSTTVERVKGEASVLEKGDGEEILRAGLEIA